MTLNLNLNHRIYNDMHFWRFVPKIQRLRIMGLIMKNILPWIFIFLLIFKTHLGIKAKSDLYCISFFYRRNPWWKRTKVEITCSIGICSQNFSTIGKDVWLFFIIYPRTLCNWIFLSQSLSFHQSQPFWMQALSNPSLEFLPPLQKVLIRSFKL